MGRGIVGAGRGAKDHAGGKLEQPPRRQTEQRRDGDHGQGALGGRIGDRLMHQREPDDRGAEGGARHDQAPRGQRRAQEPVG